MFDIGWGEFVVIGIVALIAIGPKELPGVLRSVGQWMGKIRRMAADFQGQFNEAMREAEMADLKKTVDDISTSASNLGSFDPVASVKKDFETAFDVKPPDPAISATAPADTKAWDDSAWDAAPSETPLPSSMPASVPDGALLPASLIQPIDVPLPEPFPPPTEKDFAPAATAAPSMPPGEAGGGRPA